MRWLVNTYWPKSPDRFVLPRIGGTEAEARAIEDAWLADKIIGEPQATEGFTVEELKEWGLVGVYEAN